VDEPLAVHEHRSGAGARKRFYLQRGRRLFLGRNWPAALRARHRGAIRGESALAWVRAAAAGRFGDARRARAEAGGILAAARARGERFPAETDGPVDEGWLAPPWWSRR